MKNNNVMFTVFLLLFATLVNGNLFSMGMPSKNSFNSNASGFLYSPSPVVKIEPLHPSLFMQLPSSPFTQMPSQLQCHTQSPQLQSHTQPQLACHEVLPSDSNFDSNQKKEKTNIINNNFKNKTKRTARKIKKTFAKKKAEAKKKADQGYASDANIRNTGLHEMARYPAFMFASACESINGMPVTKPQSLKDVASHPILSESLVQRNEAGYLPIHVAIEHGNLGVVKGMITMWPNLLEYKTGRGEDCLQFAESKSVEHKEKYGENLFFLQKKELVKFLVDETEKRDAKIANLEKIAPYALLKKPDNTEAINEAHFGF